MDISAFSKKPKCCFYPHTRTPRASIRGCMVEEPEGHCPKATGVSPWCGVYYGKNCNSGLKGSQSAILEICGSNSKQISAGWMNYLENLQNFEGKILRNFLAKTRRDNGCSEAGGEEKHSIAQAEKESRFS